MVTRCKDCSVWHCQEVFNHYSHETQMKKWILHGGDFFFFLRGVLVCFCCFFKNHSISKYFTEETVDAILRCRWSLVHEEEGCVPYYYPSGGTGKGMKSSWPSQLTETVIPFIPYLFPMHNFPYVLFWFSPPFFFAVRRQPFSSVKK